MKSKAIAVLVFLLSLFILAGCAKDPIQDDLMNYLNNDISKISSMEEDAAAAYASVTGNNYTDDQTMYDTLNSKVIPKYNELINKVSAIAPKTKEVQEIHKIYVNAAKTQMDGFKKILTALEKQDAGMIEDANKDLQKASSGMADYQAKLKELGSKHNVTVTLK